MESNPPELEVGVSYCMEKAEFHFGKGERKERLYIQKQIQESCSYFHGW